MAQKLETAKKEYFKNGQEKRARELLQELFNSLFDAVRIYPEAGGILDGAYALLRKIKTSNEAKSDFGKRYEVCELVRSAVFCAELLSFGEKCLLFDFQPENGFTNIPQCDFTLAFSGVLANAISYSKGETVIIKKRNCGSSFLLSVKNRGAFSPDSFYKALASNGKLGFANRLLKHNGGGLFLCSDAESTEIIMQIPKADFRLPRTAAPSAEELLYDRLSAVYVAFCGSGAIDY